MEHFSFVFTIFFMLLGPVKLIPAFAGVTRGADEQYRRAAAVRGALIATAAVAVVALIGEDLLVKYRISIDAVRIVGGLVLLLSALNTIFPKTQQQPSGAGTLTPLQLAVSPLATPIIVSPAGVAAILIFMMMTPEFPGLARYVAIALAIIMTLDLLVMYFNSTIMKVPGLMMFLQVLGSVLIFIQGALAIETILIALRHLEVITAPGVI